MCWHCLGRIGKKAKKYLCVCDLRWFRSYYQVFLNSVDGVLMHRLHSLMGIHDFHGEIGKISCFGFHVFSVVLKRLFLL